MLTTNTNQAADSQQRQCDWISIWMLAVFSNWNSSHFFKGVKLLQWITHIIWNTDHDPSRLFHIFMSHPLLTRWLCARFIEERVHRPRCPSDLGIAAPSPWFLLPDHSRRRQVRLQSDRLAPLGANGWCDGDTEGNTDSVWLTEGEAPKDKIWGCDDPA